MKQCLYCQRATIGKLPICSTDSMAVRRSIESGLSQKHRLSEELAVSLMFVLENLRHLMKLDTLDETNLNELVFILKVLKEMVRIHGFEKAIQYIEAWVGKIEVEL